MKHVKEIKTTMHDASIHPHMLLSQHIPYIIISMHFACIRLDSQWYWQVSNSQIRSRKCLIILQC